MDNECQKATQNSLHLSRSFTLFLSVLICGESVCTQTLQTKTMIVAPEDLSKLKN